jgi:hypothetical protein
LHSRFVARYRLIQSFSATFGKSLSGQQRDCEQGNDEFAHLRAQSPELENCIA